MSELRGWSQIRDDLLNWHTPPQSWGADAARSLLSIATGKIGVAIAATQIGPELFGFESLYTKLLQLIDAWTQAGINYAAAIGG